MATNEEALETLKDRLDNNSFFKEVKGAGKCIDFLQHDQSNTVFGTEEFTRENWTKGDTSNPNEAFRVRPCYILQQLVEEEAIRFKGVNCVIYDHRGGMGDREFAVWLEYYIDADRVMELEDSGELRSITKDPTMF